MTEVYVTKKSKNGNPYKVEVFLNDVLVFVATVDEVNSDCTCTPRDEVFCDACRAGFLFNLDEDEVLPY